jgi:hypothetical protein
MTRFAQCSLVSLALLLASGCSHEAPAAPAAAAEAEAAVDGALGADALVEEQDEGAIAWRVDGDGHVKAAVSTSAGARIKQDVGGALIFKVAGGQPRTVPLVMDAGTGLLVAAGPKLEADLTEVSYTVTVSGKPWSGVMHLPVGGTAALVAGAKATAEAKLPDDAVGPHGGSIQVVGGSRLEMVADADSGDTRVYVLDVDLKPVRVETRTLRMGFVAQTSTFVDFRPEPAGLYFVASIGPAVVLDPRRVTVVLGFGGVVSSAIWGHRPGVHLYAPSATVKIAGAPRLRFVLQGGFDGGLDVYGRAHTKVFIVGEDGRKGNNGRHLGQDGTWARDSGGAKSHEGRGDFGGGKAKGGGKGGKSAAR